MLTTKKLLSLLEESREELYIAVAAGVPITSRGSPAIDYFSWNSSGLKAAGYDSGSTKTISIGARSASRRFIASPKST